MNSQQMTFFEEPDVHLGGVTCISGGFPCQPHSCAGLRKASGDDRDLWPEMRRVISEIKPRWVVAENVRGLLSSENGRFFLGVLRDFAQMGYDVGWGVTSAAAVGAIHRRERVAIVAHAHSEFAHGVRLHNSLQISGKENNQQAVRDCAFPILEQLRSTEGWVYARNHEPIKSLVARKDDGFSRSLDGNRALGNAVCPQQFYPIFRAIAELEEMLA